MLSYMTATNSQPIVVFENHEETPWYDLPAHLASWVKLREQKFKEPGTTLEWGLARENMDSWLDLQAYKNACNEVAVLVGEPMPYPPKVRPPKREPPAFSFKQVEQDIMTEIATARQHAQDMAHIDMCLGGPDCCNYHNQATPAATIARRHKEKSLLSMSAPSIVDQDMLKHGKPFVPRSNHV